MTRDIQQYTTQVSETGATVQIETPYLGRTPIPTLTIVYHPMLRRIGDRVFLGELMAGRAARISRQAPPFAPPRQSLGMPLDDARISRTPFALRRLDDGSIELDPGESRTKLVIESQRITEPRRFSLAQLEHGVVIELADRVALLLHLYQSQDEHETGDLGLVGHSADIVHVREDIRRVAGLDVPVLIRGETGTGKELVVNAIHEASARRDRPLVSVNLAALPPALAAAELFGAARGAFTGAARPQEGFFRRAHGGTLFLDEIGEVPVDLQVMLLRTLETGEIYPLGAQRAEQVDVRIIAATDANLDAMVAQGAFRAPLLHRLAGYEIHLSPLCKRRDDIARLLIHFMGIGLAEIGETDRLDRVEVTPWLPMALMILLVRYHWPGNVRQLRNAAWQLVINNRGRAEAALPEALARLLEPSAAPVHEAQHHASPRPRFPDAGMESASEPDTGPIPPVPSQQRRKPSDIPEAELVELLRVHHWDIKATAAALGISRTSLYERIESSGQMRTAGELSVDEIRACHRDAGGNLDLMMERLCVSKRALRRRIRELGLA